MMDPNSINTNSVDYTHAREVYIKLMAKTEFLNKKHLEFAAEASQIQLHLNIGLITNDMVTRINQIENELVIIRNQLKDILKDISFIRRMTELNLPINFN